MCFGLDFSFPADRGALFTVLDDADDETRVELLFAFSSSSASTDPGGIIIVRFGDGNTARFERCLLPE